MANSYTVGALVRASATFKDLAGVDADPTTVKFHVFDPITGVKTTYTFGNPGDEELVKDAVGKYHVDLNVNKVGTWKYKFEGTGQNQSAQESFFDVPYTPFA
jgi:hypothetical protein